MFAKLGGTSNFAQTYAVHAALRFALAKHVFGQDTAAHRAAEALARELESEHSIYARQLKMMSLLKKGTTIVEMQKKLRASHRTIFRYLSALEDADVSIKLDGNRYFIEKGLHKIT